MASDLDHATFGGGCFWCLEAVFADLRGVERVESGYAGGHVAHPSYEAVCHGTTGHAEVVDVAFDPREISYRDLLGVFFAMHDPTTRDRQGADVGTQYRSVILTRSGEQAAIAQEVIQELEGAQVFDDPIVTEVTPLDTFYPAEAYHQQYFARNPEAPYCRVVVAPKVAKLRQAYMERLKV